MAQQTQTCLPNLSDLGVTVAEVELHDSLVNLLLADHGLVADLARMQARGALQTAVDEGRVLVVEPVGERRPAFEGHVPENSFSSLLPVQVERGLVEQGVVLPHELPSDGLWGGGVARPGGVTPLLRAPAQTRRTRLRELGRVVGIHHDHVLAWAAGSEVSERSEGLRKKMAIRGPVVVDARRLTKWETSRRWVKSERRRELRFAGCVES